MSAINFEPCNDSLTLLHRKINYLFDAENMFEKTFEMMLIRSENPILKDFLDTQRLATQSHISMLLDIFVLLGIEPERQICHGCAGFLLENRETLKSISSPALMDIALLFTAQEIGHYKIAIYKGTKSLAQQAGQSHIADILKTILGQEDESEKSLERLSHTLTTGLTQAQTN